MYENTHRRQRGMSLIEVFVALLVLSVGLIALARLQVDLVRGSSDARTRTVALALAEEKVEDLRTFAVTDNDPSAPAVCPSWSTAASPMCWVHITGPALATPADTSCSTACRGGRIAPQTAYSSALEVAGVRFKRTWEVDNRDFTNAGPPSITSRTKDVRVTVAWLNEQGVEQQVSELANVVEIPPGNVALASEPNLGRPDGPRIVYHEGAAPEVIAVPIDLGTGKRETTKPLPDVQARGYSNEVTFSVVNYRRDGSDNVVDRREEFTTVNCRCTLVERGRRRTPARVAFTGAKLRDAPGKVVNNVETGVVRTGTGGESGQPVLCGICCRDHHDGPVVDTDNNRYNPTEADTPSTPPHQHYSRTETTPRTTPPTYAYTLAAAGQPYDEACRLKRINGVFQVFEDWNLKTLTVARDQFLQTDPGLSNYVTYVQDYVRNYVEAVVGGTPTPTPTTTKPSGRDFSIAQGANAQLLGRGIYIDRMPANLVAFIADRIRAEPDFPYLEYVPFYEVNLTKLADWSLTDIASAVATNANPCTSSVAAASILCVTNQPIVDEALTETIYSRGKVYVASGAAVGSQLRVVETANTGNTGLTGTFAISTAASTTRSDSVTVTVTAP